MDEMVGKAVDGKSEDPELNPKGWRVRAWERMEREGVWGAAKALIAKERGRLLKEGYLEEEAVDAAWRLVLPQFPPEGLPVVVEEALSGEDGEWNRELTPDYIRDINWVYENLGNQSAVKRWAPSRGAWGLLLHARARPEKFYEQLLPKALAVRDKGKGEEEVGESAVVGMLDKLLGDSP